MGARGRLLRACSAVLAVVLLCTMFSLKAYAAPGDVGAWQTDDPVPDNLAWTSAVAYNGYIYLVAGANNSYYTNAVYYAELNADGSIGTWSATTTAPYSSSSSTVVAHNGYMYYIGGFDGGSGVNTASVYYAPINADGTLGGWVATTFLLDTWSNAAAVVNSGFIYLLGGSNPGPVDSVTYAPIKADGSLGPWSVTTSLPDALTAGRAVVHNNRVYYVGGNDGSVRTAGVYYAEFNPDGTLGAWQTTTLLPEEREGAGLVKYNGYLFSIGGYNAGGVVSTVYAAPINSSGAVGAWATAASMPDGRTVAGVTAYNGFVYVLAGLDSGAVLHNTAFYVPLSGYSPPTVQPVSAAAVRGVGVSVTIDVLKDATGNPDPATLAIVSGPEHGSANAVSGKIVYTPDADYLGEDSLVYRVCSANDSSVCAQATLSLTVTAEVGMPAAPNTGYAPLLLRQPGAILLMMLAGIGLIVLARCLYVHREC